jgi:hypothetical protein
MIFGCNVQVFSFFLSFFFVKGQGVILFSYINGKHEPNISLFLLFYFPNSTKNKSKDKTIQMSLVLPASGWLKKKTHLPLGGSRWALRYFILLDSELRVYKDEVNKNNFFFYS